MGAKTIPDGAAVTNHFRASFAPHVNEANLTGVSGIGDELEVIDGPDGRGYMTGKATRRDLTVMIPAHDPANKDFHAWKELCENGGVNHNITGTIEVADAADTPVEIWELSNCICKMVETTDLSIDGAEVAINTYTISYFRAKRIGP
jgi:hypothetical protein